jgi:hypothetical protein
MKASATPSNWEQRNPVVQRKPNAKALQAEQKKKKSTEIVVIDDEDDTPESSSKKIFSLPPLLPCESIAIGSLLSISIPPTMLTTRLCIATQRLVMSILDIHYIITHDSVNFRDIEAF